jgi:hypothetical protein
MSWDGKTSSGLWLPSHTNPQAYWERKLRQARQTPPSGLLVGTTLNASLPVFLTPELLRTSMQVIGSTGVGKSYMLEALIKSLILQGHGVTLLDPHGNLYHRILAFCAWLSMQRPDLQLHRRVIPFDVSNSQADHWI